MCVPVIARMSSIVTGSRRAKQRDQRAEEVRDVALVQREQQLFLAREIEVDGALGEARLVGDFGDVRDALRRAAQQPLGGIEDRVLPLLLVFGRDAPAA